MGLLPSGVAQRRADDGGFATGDGRPISRSMSSAAVVLRVSVRSLRRSETRLGDYRQLVALVGQDHAQEPARAGDGYHYDRAQSLRTDSRASVEGIVCLSCRMGAWRACDGRRGGCGRCLRGA